MGDKDKAEKILEDYEDVFADIINVLVFNGERRIKENALVDTATRSHYKADDSKLHTQERDVAKYWRTGNVTFALVGIENQTAIDKYMPLRIISYDGASYRIQKDRGGRIYPVITIVLYFGDKPWTGPKSLHESLDIPEDMKPYVSDYRINVFEIAFLSDEQINMFQSDFREIAEYFCKSRTDKNYKPSSRTIKHVDAFLDCLRALTGDPRFSEVAKAFSEDRKEGRAITMSNVLDRVEERGRTRGLEEGRAEGRAEGIREGKKEKGIEIYFSLLETGMDPEQARKIVKLSAEEIESVVSTQKK